jgi:hypothetical protein
MTASEVDPLIPVLLELICPACGALIEGGPEDLVRRARAHTSDAHDYDVSEDHVLASATLKTRA